MDTHTPMWKSWRLLQRNWDLKTQNQDTQRDIFVYKTVGLQMGSRIYENANTRF